MASLLELQAQLETLRSIRAKGIRSARFGEDEVQYRSDAELAAAIAAIEGQIASMSRRAPRLITTQVRKGY